MRALLPVLVATACGSSLTPSAGPVRFANRNPVWKVDDRHDVPNPPAERSFKKTSFYVDSYYKLAVRKFNLTRSRRSLGVNSMDEVPDSTWFTNRIGVRVVSSDEIRRGPGPDTPEQHLPWTIQSSKAGGTEPGFICEDARGEKFLLKFDRADDPETETAADAISARLLWAAGYNVPADHVVYFRREHLKLGKDAYAKVGGKKKPIDDKFVDTQLATRGREADGRIRGIASMYIPGKPLGGSTREGVRADDPNDLIDHEMRRDQRGQAAFFAWLSHDDIKEDNTVDAWQEDPANKNHHYVVHYLIDFGWALGADSQATKEPYADYRFGLDPALTFRSIIGLGLWREPWENRQPSTIRGVGMFNERDYDPELWKPANPSHFPILRADRFDKLWASKIMMRFTREQLAAAVDAGRFTHPKAKATLVDALVGRQRKTAHYWFRQTSPLDEFSIAEGHLCFTDLALAHRLETARTQYAIHVFDVDGKPTGVTGALANTAGRACTDALPLAPGPHRYTIYSISNGRGVPGVLLYLAHDAAGKPRIIGLHRK
ncbi:MAG: hypothetical protein ABI867_17415 [Kofleriaceae bacterium]